MNALQRPPILVAAMGVNGAVLSVLMWAADRFDAPQLWWAVAELAITQFCCAWTVLRADWAPPTSNPERGSAL